MFKGNTSTPTIDFQGIFVGFRGCMIRKIILLEIILPQLGGHRIHGTGIFRPYISMIFMVKVGKYRSFSIKQKCRSTINNQHPGSLDFVCVYMFFQMEYGG